MPTVPGHRLEVAWTKEDEFDTYESNAWRTTAFATERIVIVGEPQLVKRLRDAMAPELRKIMAEIEA